MSVPPSGTVTFVFSDIEGSTRLWSEHPEMMSVSLAEHDAIIRSAADRNTGYVFATAGDSFGVAFADASGAVDFAAQVQHEISDHLWPVGVEIRVRIGMHTGTAEERDGDFFGSAVNLAARVEAAGHGGQVLLSSETAALVERGDIVELGSFRLKDVVATQRVFQLGDRPFPALRTQATARGNIPGQVGRLIGREPDVQRVMALVQTSAITTIVGPGGIGKTRLALDVARRQLANHDGGAWFVELAPAVRSADVARLVANSLGIPDAQGQTPIDAITGWIADSHHLIVLDNCEHVVEGAAAFSTSALQRCPNLTVLATSREGLGVDGERLMPLAPLGESTGAVELFNERALAVDPAFDLDEHRDAVAELCRRLDGVPLALELAAARVRSISPGDLADRLDDRFRLLTAGRRSSVERHRTLRATVEWSFDLLDPDEQILFARLSVFVGVFDLRAVEQVATDERLDPVDIADVLGSLVNRSMVVSESGPFGRRFRLLETLRQFGGEVLAESADTDRFSRRHAEWYAQYLSELRVLLEGPGEVEGVLRVNEAWDNIRAAFEWSAATGDIDLGVSLTEPMVMELYFRGRIEIADWMEQLLEIDGVAQHVAYGDLVFTTSDRYRWTADRANFERLAAQHPTAEHVGLEHIRALLTFDWPTAIATAGPTADRIRSKGYDYTATASELNAATTLLYTGRLDDYDAVMNGWLERAGDGGSPTMASGCLQGLVVTSMFRGDSDRAAALMDRIVQIELPPDTGAALWVLKANRSFESGDHLMAFTEMASTISGLVQSENMSFTMLIARQFVIWMAQLDRTLDVARVMGFYRRHMGDSEIWMHADAKQHLEIRMNADIEGELATGASMSLQDGLAYMGGVYSTLAGQG